MTMFNRIPKPEFLAIPPVHRSVAKRTPRRPREIQVFCGPGLEMLIDNESTRLRLRLPFIIKRHVPTPLKVMIVEDTEKHRCLLGCSVRSCPAFLLIGKLASGKTLLSYLAGEGPYRNRQAYPLPDLLLMDVSNPQITSEDILGWLKNHPLSSLKVVVFTDSTLPEDYDKFLQLGAFACYSKCGFESQIKEIANNLLGHDYNK
jgi:CheY-like chemotaxis protein